MWITFAQKKRHSHIVQRRRRGLQPLVNFLFYCRVQLNFLVNNVCSFSHSFCMSAGFFLNISAEDFFSCSSISFRRFSVFILISGECVWPCYRSYSRAVNPRFLIDPLSVFSSCHMTKNFSSSPFFFRTYRFGAGTTIWLPFHVTR